nr:TetR/AcrR family transcriptional regulator [Pseudomonas sp. VI4.1]
MALELFAEHGFQGVSLRQLAAVLPVQAGSLYNHIESKQALLFELIEEHENDLRELLQTEVPRQADGLLQLETYVRMHLQFNCLHDQRHTLVRLEFHSLSLEQRDNIERLRNARVRHLEYILGRCALPASERTRIALGMQVLLDGVGAGYPNGGRPPLENLAALFSSLVLSGSSKVQAERTHFFTHNNKVD